MDLSNGHAGDTFNLGGDVVDDLQRANGLDPRRGRGAERRHDLGQADHRRRHRHHRHPGHDLTPSLPGAIDLVGTTVVHGTSGSAANFTWVGRHKGFVDYELQFFSGPVNWNIVGLPSHAAFEMLKAPAIAQDFWRRTGDAWSARDRRSATAWGLCPAPRGEGWEMWAGPGGGENIGRDETFTVGGLGFRQPGHRSSWRGFQMGGDNLTSKNWLWGFTGGFWSRTPASAWTRTPSTSPAGTPGSMPASPRARSSPTACSRATGMTSRPTCTRFRPMRPSRARPGGPRARWAGAWGPRRLYLEPLADLAWTSTRLDDAKFPAQATTFTFGNATSLSGSIGGRVGGRGVALPYVGLYAAQEFDGKNDMTMITGAGCPFCQLYVDHRPEAGLLERADFGFTTTSWNGLEGFLKGEAEFGGHTDGFTGRLGVRWRW